MTFCHAPVFSQRAPKPVTHGTLDIIFFRRVLEKGGRVLSNVGGGFDVIWEIAISARREEIIFAEVEVPVFPAKGGRK